MSLTWWSNFHSKSIAIHREMYSTDFLPSLLRQISVSGRLNSILYDFDRNTGNFFMTKNFSQIRIFRIQIVSQLAYCIFMLAHLLVSDLPKAKTLQGFVFCCIYFIGLGARWNYDMDVNIVQIINSSMEFEKKLVEGTCILIYWISAKPIYEILFINI